ncbi:alpha-(1,3)-fucosyltransferase C-like [Uranotaenia lowii]|uniref:alpha-(1,3)-fucosyltransferase C-like n=1 Tax=Uranotaenia lowii TaxID=190385 RepID=UPI0024795709|nr:alpha-(1,3)-fucosyltransferase C-like [Uranotaenia lowii]
MVFKSYPRKVVWFTVYMARSVKRHRLGVLLVIILLFIVLCISLLIHTQCLKPSIAYYQILEEHLEQDRLRISRSKYILFYTNFFDVDNWLLDGETVGPDYLRSLSCPETDCVLTNNRELLDRITDYDALVYHIAEPWAYSLLDKVPKQRSPHQIYIAATMESPAHTKHLLGGDRDFFNWTMTYRLDSDIVWPYNTLVDIDTDLIVSPAAYPPWKIGAWQHYQNESLLQLAMGKNKMAAQFVSHCGAFSRRDELVRAIQKLVQVDVYGKCGTLECTRGSKRCSEMLNTDYWFYFSFENSLCRDYVTEKLFEPMASNIVPVVFGGSDYRRFAPPNSFIDVQDYESVEKLVEHLQYLVDNPREYVKYFWWKEHYRIAEGRPFCDLCKKLHYPSARERTQYYRNIMTWWFNEVCQKEARIKF